MNGRSSAARRMYWATVETLLDAHRLFDMGGSSDEVALRDRARAALRQLVIRCHAAGVPEKEAAEARYATVAFIDEQVLKSDWAGRFEWMKSPLQLQLYGETAAGEHFFRRLDALLQHSDRSPALVVYYLCLALGFRGARTDKTTREDAVSYLEAIQRSILEDGGGVVSPKGLPAISVQPSRTSRRWTVLRVAAACAFVIVFGLGLFSLSLRRAVIRADGDLRAAAAL